MTIKYKILSQRYTFAGCFPNLLKKKAYIYLRLKEYLVEKGEIISTFDGVVNTELQQYVEQHIIPRYDGFDKAHQRDHVMTVIRQSMELACKLGADSDMAYTIAAYHDTGLCEGRERHHEVSAQIIRADRTLRKWFTEEQVKTEASRCLSCGAARVDPNICIGCGLCTTRCNFDAIHLHRAYDAWGVPYEKLVGHVVKTTAQKVGRRIIGKEV